MERLRWPVAIQPLSAVEAGGFLALAPGLPGCIRDEDTPEQALANVLGHAIPAPMWYSDPETAPAVGDIAEPGTQAGSGPGAGKRLKGHGPDRK